MKWRIAFALLLALAGAAPAQLLVTGAGPVSSSGCSGVNLLASGDFTAGWNGNNATLTPNAVTGPGGGTTAATLVEAVDVGQYHDAYTDAITKASAPIIYTLSFSVHQSAVGLARNVAFYVSDFAGVNFVGVEYNAATGAIITPPFSGGGFVSVGTGFVADGGGFLRFYLSAVSDSGADVTGDIALMSGSNETYNGNGISGLYLANAMLAADRTLCPYVAPAAVGCNGAINLSSGCVLPMLGGL